MDGNDLNAFVCGNKDRVQQDMKMHDNLNHILGNYMAFAVNDPKSYPKKPLLHKSLENIQTKELTIEQQQEQWLKWLRVMGAKEVENGNNY